MSDVDCRDDAAKARLRELEAMHVAPIMTYDDITTASDTFQKMERRVEELEERNDRLQARFDEMLRERNQAHARITAGLIFLDANLTYDAVRALGGTA